MCSIASESTDDATVGWLINHVGPHGVNALLNGLVAGYSGSLGTTDLIIENIMMKDHRNDTAHQCMILQNTTIKGNPIRLLVAGMYIEDFIDNGTFTIC